MIDMICQTCKIVFKVKPYRKNEAKYCSLECRDIGAKGRKPVNKGIFTRRVTLNCEYCGQEFEQIKSRLKWGRGKHCSPECQYRTIKDRPRKNQIEFSCLNCGNIFALHKSRNREKGAGKYCSRKCRDDYRIGENHPQYINGASWDHHGPNWASQRRRALRRDNNTCQLCRITKEESQDNFGQSLAVHHIVPYRFFNGEWKEANKLKNLITLCHSCHRIEEAKIQATSQIKPVHYVGCD